MKKKNGFTLIELLAVIIILGILMIIAIPSVTKYISDSRKSAYIDTAKEAIGSARNFVNSGELEMYDTDVTYYLDVKCIKTENALKSPYGDFIKAYVVVTYDGKGYDYLWTSVDDAGQGIRKITKIDNLDINSIESDLSEDDIKDTLGIDGRDKYIIINKDQTNCGKGISTEVSGKISGATGQVLYSLCKKATDLHKKNCTRLDGGCNDTIGYGKIITYGKKYSGSISPGDAFDCDVNGDDIYDPITERFYYVSNYYDTNTNSFDNTKATLIYYTCLEKGDIPTNIKKYAYSTRNSVRNMGKTCDDTHGCNWYGPDVAYTHLPSTTQWSNQKLITTLNDRQIVNNLGGTTTSGGSIAKFTYENKAARFITYQEIKQACGNNLSVSGSLDNCIFLLENIEQFESSSGIYGYWIENPEAGESNKAFFVGDGRDVTSVYVSHLAYGVRPTITVNISDIEQ